VSDYIYTNDLQFGFKKHLGCRDAILTAKLAIKYFLDRGSTVSICALDLSKAFDKVDFYGLFIKLLSRHVPNWFMQVITHWYSKCSFVVKWDNVYSNSFLINAGVRQGGILSPFLFNVFIDSMIESLAKSGHGIHINGSFLGCIVYADDLLLISNTVSDMQCLLDICTSQAVFLNLKFNVDKSMAMRVGTRFKIKCVVLLLCGKSLNYVSEIRYLGVILKTGRTCSFQYTAVKASFYRSFNAIYRQSKYGNSELTTVYLLSNVCIPILTYALEATGPNRGVFRSLDGAIDNALRKIFGIYESNNVSYVRHMLKLRSIECLYKVSTFKCIKSFMTKDLSFANTIACLAYN
jgi:hypothetical protein